MVTEGPAGEDTSVYDITLSEIHQHVWDNMEEIPTPVHWATFSPDQDCSLLIKVTQGLQKYKVP